MRKHKRFGGYPRENPGRRPKDRATCEWFTGGPADKGTSGRRAMRLGVIRSKTLGVVPRNAPKLLRSSQNFLRLDDSSGGGGVTWRMRHQIPLHTTPHNGDCIDWVAFARDKPAQWKTRVKRAVKKSILSPETLPISGFLVQPTEMTECEDCGKICRGMGGLRAHQFRVHGRRCESRLFALGSICRWCMTDFRSRPRLIVHFRKCPACVDGMRMYV